MKTTERTPTSSHLTSRGACKAKLAKAGFVTGVSLLIAGLACAGGCASLAPAAVKWGADLISAASNNYSQQYSRQLETLLVAFYAEQVRRVSGERVSESGQGAYPPSGNQGQPYPAVSSAPQQPYPSQSDPYPKLSNPSPGQASPYPQIATPPSGGPIVLDVAILAQRASARAAQRTDPVPIQDGEVLRDGGADPRRGDVVKFSFRAHCDCYVYIIAVDATGYVLRVFPEKGGQPVRANQQYVVPQGTAWYGLDEHKGTEQIFFLASRKPRRDIETSLVQLAKTDRNSLAKNFRPVREAALPDPATRGLVKVQMGTKSTVSSESGRPYSFTPQAFAAPSGSDDVAVTRWFRHE